MHVDAPPYVELLRRLNAARLLVDAADWTRVASGLESKTLAGTQVPVVGRRALIEMKRASGRPQDLADADALSEMAGGGDDEEG